MFNISLPSILMNESPSYSSSGLKISTILKIAWIVLDLPAPVLPQTPIFSPDWILKLIFLSVKSKSSLYLNLTFTNLILPFLGQLSFKFLSDSKIGRASYSSFV